MIETPSGNSRAQENNAIKKKKKEEKKKKNDLKGGFSGGHTRGERRFLKLEMSLGI